VPVVQGNPFFPGSTRLSKPFEHFGVPMVKFKIQRSLEGLMVGCFPDDAFGDIR
jgi:hypothetical protein